MHRNSPKPGNDLEQMWSNNYTQAIRAVALENGPHLGPGMATPTNNTNCIEFTMNTVFFTMNSHLFFQWTRIRTMLFILVFSDHRWLYDKLASTQYKYYCSHKEYPCLYYESATKPYTIVVFFEWIPLFPQWISIRSIHLNNTNNMVSAMNTIVSTMNQHQSHANSLGSTMIFL